VVSTKVPAKPGTRTVIEHAPENVDHCTGTPYAFNYNLVVSLLASGRMNISLSLSRCTALSIPYLQYAIP
jgi:hypothetical protein